MPGIWTDPRTWVDGETPTGAQFNTHLRDNLNYLKDAPSFDGDLAVGGDITLGGDLVVTDEITVGGGAEITDDLVVKGNTTLGDAPTDKVDIKGTVENASLKNYSETKTAPAIVTGTLTLDYLLGTFFAVGLTSNCTVVCPNLPAGRVVGITVVFTGDGTVRTVTWPVGTVWPEGLAPTLTGTLGKRDVFTLLWDGTAFFGVVVGLNY